MLFRIVLFLILVMITACSKNSVEPTHVIEPSNAPSESIPMWIPSPGMSFQIQFSGDPDLSIAADIFDLDAFDTESSTVETLHQNGKFVICYINAGAVEDWRPDVTQFPPQLVGKEYQGWPGENWLDIRDLKGLAPILEARLDLCRSKGFDGVEFDNVDGYQNDTGFDLTASDQLAYNRWLAEAAHQRGLAVGLKNDPDQIHELEPWFDFLILESCFEQGWCDQAKPFTLAEKLVIDIEYSDTSKYCPQVKDKSITLIEKNRELSAKSVICH